MSEETEGGLQVEATGETVGEAKWAALRDLEQRYPGLDKGKVRFVVVSEGERGLLGVGFTPARVIASLEEAPASGAPPEEEAGSPPARVRELLDRICRALGVPVTVSIAESESGIVATLSGSELGLLIGKRGQTLDAIQYLANAVLMKNAELGTRPDVVIDAAGYRARRQSALERLAERAARDAVRTGAPVELEAMSSVERKIVHVYLKELGGVETESDGNEPNRFVVVRPAE
jgi:spoIIIJ-associated protein